MAARSLETILAVRRRAEDDAARALREAARVRERAEAAHRSLEAQAAEARDARGAAQTKLKERGGARLVDEEMAVRGHVARLGDDVRSWTRKVESHRRGSLAGAKKTEAAAQAAWLAARAAREVVERKLEEAQAQRAARGARRAQTEMDERATWIYVERQMALRGKSRA
jgi:hypothetical protein